MLTCIVFVLCDIHQVGQIQNPYLINKGSPSPTIEDEADWMAPLMPMQYKARLNRIMGEILFEKSPIEPPKPEKPYIDERPPRPKEGQQILTDSTKKIIV